MVFFRVLEWSESSLGAECWPIQGQEEYAEGRILSRQAQSILGVSDFFTLLGAFAQVIFYKYLIL